MKRLLLLLASSLMAFSSATAQTICPMVQDGKIWIYEASNFIYDWEETFRLEGDTVISSRKCLKLYYTCQIYGQDHLYKGAMFEEGGNVYIILPGSTTPDLIYDFSSEPGTIINVGPFELRINEKKLVKYHGEYLKVIYYSPLEEEGFEGQWIEGLGTISGGHLSTLTDGAGTWYDGGERSLKSCKVNGEVVFEREDFNTSAHAVAGEEDVHKYYPEGTKWTEIRLDTLKYDSWYSKVGDEWVPNFETIEYRVQGEYNVLSWDNPFKGVYTNGPEWTDSLTLIIYEDNSSIDVSLPFFSEDKWGNHYIDCCPGRVYQFDWSIGQGLYYRDICESNSTSEYPYYFYYGIIDEIKEGDFGGVRPLKYVDLDGKAPYIPSEPGNDTRGGRIIQGIGITEWNDGECLFGPPNPYQALRFFDYYYGDKYPERHYRSMLVHFERDGEVLYDVWPEMETVTEEPLPFLEGNPIWVFKYEPMQRAAYWANGHWDECFLDAGNQYYTYYFLGGKKELEGKVYTMMSEVGCDKDGKITLNRRLPVREENGIVYAFTDSLPGLVEFDYLEPPYLQQGKECVLYNFNTKIGESLYPQNETFNEAFTVGSYGTYQLMDGTECRVLKTRYDKDLDLYEKLGFLHGTMIYGVMDPPSEILDHLGGNVSPKHLNAYYQDDVMLYKTPDAPEGLCVNDTCWTHDDAYDYAMSYKANPYHEEVMSYIRQLQAASEPVTFTKDQMATIILPTAPDASKGKYYRLDRVEDNHIIFEQELQPQARTPYIIVPNEDFSIDLSSLDLEGLTQDVVSIEGISFIGSYVREELEQQEGSYIDIIDMTPDCTPLPGEGQGERLFIGVLRAYLIVHWDDPYNPGGTKGPEEKMGIVLRDYGTGIGDAQRLNDKGQMINDKWYDLSGRKLSGKPARGIYIKEGKKKVKN